MSSEEEAVDAGHTDPWNSHEGTRLPMLLGQLTHTSFQLHQLLVDSLARLEQRQCDGGQIDMRCQQLLRSRTENTVFGATNNQSGALKQTSDLIFQIALNLYQ